MLLYSAPMSNSGDNHFLGRGKDNCALLCSESCYFFGDNYILTKNSLACPYNLSLVGNLQQPKLYPNRSALLAGAGVVEWQIFFFFLTANLY